MSKPYAGVSTAILLFTKTNSGGTDRVWFYDVDADGWSLDDKRTPLLSEDKLGPTPRTALTRDERAPYGGRIVDSLGKQLSGEFGRGFEAKNLRRMAQFAELFPDPEIVASVMRQLSWTHFLQLIPVKLTTQRDFYARMAAAQGWSVRELRRRIESKTYERTAIAGTQGGGVERALTELDRSRKAAP